MSVASEMHNGQTGLATPNARTNQVDGPKRPMALAPMGDGNGNSDRRLLDIQRLQKSDMQASYAQDMSSELEPEGLYGSMINCLGACVGTIGSVPICFCFPNPYKKVEQGTVGLVSRFGRFFRAVDPGLVRVNPFSESLSKVDIRIQITSIGQQVLQTKDNVQVSLDSVFYWHVVSPYKAAFGITNVKQALIERTQTTLRHIGGGRVLQDLIENREALAYEIQEIIAGPADTWGVKVESVLIKDISFSTDLQQSLSAAATAKRIGESKVISARAEVESARLMREAADILSSEAAMQIRQLETYQAMAKSTGAKVIFVPMGLAGAGGSGSGHSQLAPLQASQLSQMANI